MSLSIPFEPGSPAHAFAKSPQRAAEIVLVADQFKEKLIKIGAKVVSHGRYVAFQMAEVAIPYNCSRKFCGSSRTCGRSHHQRQYETFDSSCVQVQPTGRVCPNAKEKWPDPPLRLAVELADLTASVCTRFLSCSETEKTRVFTHIGDSFGESREQTVKTAASERSPWREGT